MNVQKILIAGFGRMGQDIAYWLASKGISVVVQTRRSPKECRQSFETELVRLINEKKLREAVAQDIGSRICFVNSPKYSDVDWIIECLEEDPAKKKYFFASLPKEFGGVVSTNTSTISVDNLSTYVPDARLFLGTHFFNPVFAMPLVEIVAGGSTDPMIIQEICDFLDAHDKVPVQSPDQVGFLVNRILFACMFEAMEILSRGRTEVKAIDTCIKLGCAWPMGPLELADFIGLDVCERIMKNLADDKSFCFSTVPSILRKTITAGHLGRKSGKGFYDYGSTSGKQQQ